VKGELVKRGNEARRVQKLRRVLIEVNAEPDRDEECERKLRHAADREMLLITPHQTVTSE
jgi:hypothetical protein